MDKNKNMKRTNTSIPDRIYRQWKQWIASAEIDATMEEWMCWIMSNLPEMPKNIKQDLALLKYLDDNQQSLKYSQDQKKLLRLIAKGLIAPDQEDLEIIQKIKKQI